MSNTPTPVGALSAGVLATRLEQALGNVIDDASKLEAILCLARAETLQNGDRCPDLVAACQLARNEGKLVLSKKQASQMAGPHSIPLLKELETVDPSTGNKGELVKLANQLFNGDDGSIGACLRENRVYLEKVDALQRLALSWKALVRNGLLSPEQFEALSKGPCGDELVLAATNFVEKFAKVPIQYQKQILEKAISESDPQIPLTLLTGAVAGTFPGAKRIENKPIEQDVDYRDFVVALLVNDDPRFQVLVKSHGLNPYEAHEVIYSHEYICEAAATISQPAPANLLERLVAVAKQSRSVHLLTFCESLQDPNNMVEGFSAVKNLLAISESGEIDGVDRYLANVDYCVRRGIADKMSGYYRELEAALVINAVALETEWVKLAYGDSGTGTVGLFDVALTTDSYAIGFEVKRSWNTIATKLANRGDGEGQILSLCRKAEELDVQLVICVGQVDDGRWRSEGYPLIKTILDDCKAAEVTPPKFTCLARMRRASQKNAQAGILESPFLDGETLLAQYSLGRVAPQLELEDAAHA